MKVINKIIGVIAGLIACALGYSAMQSYLQEHVKNKEHEHKTEYVLSHLKQQIEDLQEKNKRSINQIESSDKQDVIIQNCGGEAAPCSQSNYCCSGCCYAGVCTSNSDAYWCCQGYGQPCTGSNNPSGDCCDEYICAACYLPNNGSNDIMAAPSGTGGLCQTNTSWTVIDCGSGGLGAPCYNTLACQSDYVCSKNMCECDPDGCGGITCPCTSNTECCQGNCYLGYCQAPEANCIECYNDGQCASGNCVSTDGVTSYCYVDECIWGMETCDTCFSGTNCQACNNSSNCETGNCVNGLCYITDCMYGASACGSCYSGDLGDTCNSDNNCQSQYICTDGFCSCTNPPGYNCQCDSGGVCLSGLVCSDANFCVDCYADGGPCNYDNECCNGTCIAGSCSYAPAIGGECNDNSQCGSGECDNAYQGADGLCEECVGENLPCWNTGQCCAGLDCISGVCSCSQNEPGGNGCLCSSPTECQSNNCDGITCVPCYSTGMACESDNQCCATQAQTTSSISCTQENVENGNCYLSDETGNIYTGSGMDNHQTKTSTGATPVPASQQNVQIQAIATDGSENPMIMLDKIAFNANHPEFATNKAIVQGDIDRIRTTVQTDKGSMICTCKSDAVGPQCIQYEGLTTKACSCAPANGCLCNSNDQCDSGNCYAGLCDGDCLSKGLYCDSSGQCCTGLTCSLAEGQVSNTCNCSTTEPAANGCPCQTQSECASDFCSNGTCSAPLSDGLPCTTTNECSSHQCIEGMCSCAPNNGCICDTNSQCNSGDCQAGICESCQITAMSCSDPGQCCSNICNDPTGDGIGTCGCSPAPNAEESCPCANNTDCMSGNCVAGLCQDCFAAGLACSENYECCNNDCSDFICGGVDEWINWIVMAVVTVALIVLDVLTDGAASAFDAQVEEAADASLQAGEEAAAAGDSAAETAEAAEEAFDSEISDEIIAACE